MTRGQPSAGGVKNEREGFSHDAAIVSETGDRNTSRAVPSDAASAYSPGMAQRSHDPTDRRHAAPVEGRDEIPLEDTHADSTLVPADESTPATRTHEQDAVPDSSGGLLGSAWVGLVLGALVTILLLIFIAQNTTSTDVRFLGLEFTLPLGVLILFAAIAGALIMALFAGFRILQLRMRARKARKLTARH